MLTNFQLEKNYQFGLYKKEFLSKLNMVKIKLPIFENIGKESKREVCARLGVPIGRFLDWELKEHVESCSLINNHAELFLKQQNIKTLQLISSYRGHRHSLNMPVRGQRTHSNSKTRRKRKIS
ncbi:MAG TPA: 30S ribosomal protein S13 [Saprospiraceae bacterium]|nr:30S ribosomal protein S13 [Saprospiraceae bacterium]